MRFPVLSEAKLSFVPWLIVDDIGIADVPLIQVHFLATVLAVPPQASVQCQQEIVDRYIFLWAFLY